jgi:hypothetical protein
VSKWFGEGRKDCAELFGAAGEDEECTGGFGVSGSCGCAPEFGMHVGVRFYGDVFSDAGAVEVVDGMPMSWFSCEDGTMLMGDRDSPAPMLSTTPYACGVMSDCLVALAFPSTPSPKSIHAWEMKMWSMADC